MSVKSSNDPIGNRTRDLPTCSAVSQPSAPPRAPICMRILQNNMQHSQLTHVTSVSLWVSSQFTVTNVNFLVLWSFVLRIPRQVANVHWPSPATENTITGRVTLSNPKHSPDVCYCSSCVVTVRTVRCPQRINLSRPKSDIFRSVHLFKTYSIANSRWLKFNGVLGSNLNRGIRGKQKWANLSQFSTWCTKFFVYLFTIHLLKSCTCFEQYAANLQEV